MGKWLAVFVLVLIPATVFAQPDMSVPVPAFEWYSSIGGIVAATAVLVAIAKRALGNVRGLNAIPTWVYAVVISFALTVIAAVVLKTLPGVWWQDAIQAVLMAGAASGFYEWLKPENIQKPLAHSAKSAGVKVKQANLPKGMKP